jgi:hypothetical protein
MTVGSPAGTDGKSASLNEKLDRSETLLREALELIDAATAPAEIGARVQEALDALQEYNSAQKGFL